MDFKAVGKSKSSNGNIASLAGKSKNKKSFSNAEFQPSVMKKRGVYVEKKIHSSTDTNEANTVLTKKKPPPRPRPGQKKFLASVLTILSKSTTGTQYPDIQEEDAKMKLKTKLKQRWKTTNDAESKTIQKVNKMKKTKFRSRVLNEEMLRSEREQLIILQSRRDIAQTPSNYSARSKTATDSVKWSDVLQENDSKRSTIKDILENNIYSGVAEGITKEVLEGRTKKEKKLRINDDPVTLASEIAKRDDKKLYNFFVDLLETTISVYNVKTDYDLSETSKTVLEINDSVAKKLEFKNATPSHDDVNRASKCCRRETEKEVFNAKDNIPIDIKLSEHKPLAPIRQKVKAKSFLYTNYRKIKSPPKSNSFESTKKNIRRPKKRELLNVLKEQLRKHTLTFDEPECLYDALKIMARNKRRCAKTIHFDKMIRENNDYDSECMFQRRKVISFGAKKRNKLKNIITTAESGNYHNYDKEMTYKKYFPSHHSLEVYGYDYEEPVKLPERKQRRVIFTYHSTPSVSDSNLGDYNALLNYPDSSASSNYCL